MTSDIEKVVKEVERALKAKIDAHRRYLAYSKEVTKANYDYRQAQKALFNLEIDSLQDQEDD